MRVVQLVQKAVGCELRSSTLVAASSATAQTHGEQRLQTAASHRHGHQALRRVRSRTRPACRRLRRRAGFPTTFGKCCETAAFPKSSDGVITALTGATASVRGGSCSDSTPEDGTIVECDFQPGATIEWMAHRPNVERATGRRGGSNECVGRAHGRFRHFSSR